MPDLSRKRLRDALPERREPHWQCLARGCFLGFRRGPQTWIARFRDRDGSQHHFALTGVHENDYDEAKRRAEEWLLHMGATGVRSVRRATVREAIEAYLSYLKRQEREDAAERARALLDIAILRDPLADMALERVTSEDFTDWRERLRKDGVKRLRRPMRTRGRQPRTINRYVSIVTTALNRARRLGYARDPAAWKLERIADDRDDEGAVFLDPAQRRALLAAAEPHAADFLRALELTGARPHEMANALVSHFDGETLRLAHRKGNPPKLRIRYTVLSVDALEHIRRAAKDKHPSAPLFTDYNGNPWTKATWIYAVNSAAARHNASVEKDTEKLPKETRAYSFRHARISELLQVHGIDPVTVALQCGTSVQMIEKHYHRFIASAMKEKLAQIRDC